MPSHDDIPNTLKEKIRGMSVDEARKTVRDELTQLGFRNVTREVVDTYLDALRGRPPAGLTVRRFAHVIRHGIRLHKKGRLALRRLGGRRACGPAPDKTPDGGPQTEMAGSRGVAPHMEWGLPLVVSIAYPLLTLGVAGGAAYFATRTHGAIRGGLIAISAVFGLVGLAIAAFDLAMARTFPLFARTIESILREVKPPEDSAGER